MFKNLVPESTEIAQGKECLVLMKRILGYQRPCGVVHNQLLVTTAPGVLCPVLFSLGTSTHVYIDTETDIETHSENKS